MGEIADEHAAAMWDLDDYELDEDDFDRPIRCRSCGKTNLHWTKETGEYRLANDNGALHRCSIFKRQWNE